MDVPIQIGSCDNLVLDARDTKNLGLRNGIFEWNIYELKSKWYGDLVVISNENISVLNDVILIGLTVQSWFGGISHVNITVYKSSLETIPMVDLYGINEYSFNNNKILNGKIDIYSSIMFVNSCNNEDIILNENDFKILWFVNVEKQNANEHIVVIEKLFITKYL